MKNFLKNTLALISGFITGGIVNISLIMIGSSVIALPAGVDATDMESLKAGMHLFEAKHFIFPFLAHALGTLVGAVVAAWLAVEYKYMYAMAIGVFFLIGGVSNVLSLPAPLWFIAADLAFAYIPMAWLGYKGYQKWRVEVGGR